MTNTNLITCFQKLLLQFITGQAHICIFEQNSFSFIKIDCIFSSCQHYDNSVNYGRKSKSISRYLLFKTEITIEYLDEMGKVQVIIVTDCPNLLK